MVVSIIAAFSGTVWEKLLEWYRGSVFRELIAYFDETYFSVSLGDYQHFSVSAQTGSVVRNLILSLALGIIIAAACSCYVRQVHGGFIRRLIRDGCTTPQSAKSLYELGYFNNISIRKQLCRSGSIAGLVKSVTDAGEPSLTEKTLSGARFYLPEEHRDQAEFRYARKGSDLLALVLTVLFTVIATVVVCRFLPQILGLADVILGIFEH